MAESSTSYKKGDKPSSDRPTRGKAQKTLILEAIRESALLNCGPDTSKEDAEREVFKFLAESAFNPTEETANVSNTALQTLMKKGWPDVKAVAPCVKFDFDADADKSAQAIQIMNAVSNSEISPDTGVNLINALSSIIKIKEADEFENRLKALEQANNDEG